MKLTLRASAVAALILSGGMLAGAGQAQDAQPPRGAQGADAPKAPKAAPDAGKKFQARLDGKSEVPGPGDEDGRGVFAARLNREEGRLCYSMKVIDVAAPTAAHIHIGPAGSSGEVALTLEAPARGEATGCVDVDREVADALIQTPENFYVNVHNAEFRDGAIRGQLAEG